MSLFAHFSALEARAFIDAYMALVGMPDRSTSWA